MKRFVEHRLSHYDFTLAEGNGKEVMKLWEKRFIGNGYC